jgi:hypothetical protein
MSPYLGMDEFIVFFHMTSDTMWLLEISIDVHVYFVAMLALGGLGTYVQCKHVYHILQLIMFCGFMEDFIHYCMWNWDVVQCLL